MAFCFAQFLTFSDSSSSSSGPPSYEDIEHYDPYTYPNPNVNANDDPNGGSLAGDMHGVNIPSL